MIRTSWINDQPIKVVASYSVAGSDQHPDFPYLNDLPSLREAIANAKRYRSINTLKGAGRVKRHITVYHPNSDTQTACSWQTHEWFVHVDGRLELSSWGKKVKSPAGQLQASTDLKDRQANLMHVAAERDTGDMTPAAYNAMATLVLSTLFRSARMAGLRCVREPMPDHMKQGDEWLAKRRYRDECEQFLARQINETLAHAGFRTLDEASLKAAFADIPAAEDICW